MTAASPDFSPTRFGKYLLLKRVATGGMAELFLALEESAHGARRFVTIKCIRPDLAEDPDYVDFFITEGRVLLRCTHANLPQVYELGVENGVHYLSMEFIRGHTLLDVIRSACDHRVYLTPELGLRMGIKVAAALEHAHDLRDIDGKPMGVIHRDVSPQNIMMAASGEVKLIDFGIVRSTVQSHLTRTGIVKGKFSYMAPEQLSGPKQIDHRCDLFSLGVVLHETLAGRSLFRAKNSSETIERVRNAPIPRLDHIRPDIPQQLNAVVLRALERSREERYQTATELLEALEEVARECNIHHSVSRLRREVKEHCGEPPLPALDDSAAAALQSAVQRRAVGTESPVPAPQSPESHGIAERDPDLAYFLQQAGCSGHQSGDARRPTHADSQLAQLLARLDAT